MPTMKPNGKTMQELIAEIRAEKERNQEFSERFDRQLSKLQNYMDDYEKFDSIGSYIAYDADTSGRIESRNKFMNRIQIGSKTLPEFLENVKGGKNNSQMLYFAAAFAAAMEPLDKNRQIEMNVFVSDKNGNVKSVPVVENAEKKPAVRKEDLNLWDKLCNAVGYKTEKYRAYEAEQKRIEMEERFKKTDTRYLHKNAITDSFETDNGIKDNKKILKEAVEKTDAMNKLFFGDKKPEDWVMRDGTKLSALSVCMGILSGKEVGVKDVWTECNPEQLQEKYGEDIKKAVGIYEDLLAKRQLEKDNPSKFDILDEFLSDKKTEFKISSRLEQEFLSKVEPHPEIESFMPVLSKDGERYVRNVGAFKPFMKAKEELYRATKNEKLEPKATEDIILKGELYTAELKGKLKAAVKDINFDQKSTMNLCDNIIKAEVYTDMLKSHYMDSVAKGEKCHTLDLDEKKSVMENIASCINDYWGLSKDSSRVHTIEAAEMILQNKVGDAVKLKMILTPNSEAKFRTSVEKLEMPFDKEREYETESAASHKRNNWNKFDIQKDLDKIVEVKEKKQEEPSVEVVQFNEMDNEPINSL